MTRNRRVALAVALVALLLAVAGIGSAFAWGGSARGMIGGFGPNSMMGGTTGQGMMGGSNGMMGAGAQGMMGGASNQGSQSQGQPINLDQAVKNVQTYVDQTANKDLVVDEVMEFQSNFYAIVKEKSSGNGAFELLVDKTTGAVFPEMGPNMMWNTKYGMQTAGASSQCQGMMSGMMGGVTGGMMGGASGMMGSGAAGMMNGQYPVTPPTGPMTVSSDQAKALARQWLDQNQPGTTTESPDQFAGYYTVHTLKDAKVAGMLSVNGYTGQVWYHTWHGDFVQLKELGG